MREKIFLGIDVGTGSVRAGAFDRRGHLRGKADHPITTWRPRPDFVEQSSQDIWKSTARATKRCLEAGRIDPRSVKGISFDATCSLVALGEGFEPVTVSPTKRGSQNIIVWMDHRAIRQADHINQTGHGVLKYMGGKISPEMEPPKLMWLKENLKESWRRARVFLDLADYMVYRSTGNDARSLCTAVCKWTYLAHEGEAGRYRYDFFEQIGIADLLDRGKVPQVAYAMGKNAGGLAKAAAIDLGLPEGTPVGVGIIDAHAGGIGSLGSVLTDSYPGGDPFEKSLALIGGTSSCHMAVSREPRFVDGVWGPYYSAMIPGMWLNEGGQSATGSLLDLVIRNNASHGAIVEAAQKDKMDVYTFLNQRVRKLKRKKGFDLVRNLHVLPYYYGNRSPRADPYAKGMVSGLTLSDTPDDVATLYCATIQALAYGTRHIIEAMNDKGYQIRKIHLSGGHLKNRLFIQEHADITGCEILLPKEPEAVLLGAAILAAVAAGEYSDIPQAMETMSREGGVIKPDPSTFSFHEAKYELFKEMYDFQRAMRQTMEMI